MAAGRLFVPNYFPAEDANGDRIDGAKLYFYDYDGAPTTELKAVYTSSALTTMLSNPVVADSVGVFPAIWADTAERFTVAVTDAAGAPIITYDNVSPSIDATLASVALAESAQAAAEAAEEGAEASAAAAAASAITAASANGSGVVATSATSLTIGTGSKTVALAQSGKPYAVGMDILIADVVTPTNRMIGMVTAFVDPLLTVNVARAEGAGTHSSWSVAQIPVGSPQVGSLTLAGATDSNLLVVDYASDQVSVGAAPVAPANAKLYSQSVVTDPAPYGSEAAAIQSRLDYQPSANSASNVTGVYGTTWLNKAADYSGGPVAVRGNVYTIDQGVGLVNVTSYMAGGIFRARQEAKGTIAQAIAVLADAAQKGSNAGTITKTIGVRVDGTLVGALNYGVYFNNDHASGHLASSPATDIRVSPGETLSTWTFSRLGYSVAKSSDGGVIQLGDWGELVETSGALVGLSANIYTKRSDSTFRYRNTHASVGGALILHNSAAFQTSSFFYAPPGTAGNAATFTETLRVNGGAVAANATALLIVVNNGAQVLKTVEIGASDSGGVGYRMLRVLN